MSRKRLTTVLGHPLDPKVIALAEEVQGAFPSKELIIHPIQLAEKESGKTVDSQAPAVSMPEISGYIAIWIKQEFSTEEFNAVLAEELIHHLQAYHQFPEVISLKSILGVTLDPYRNLLTDFRQDLCSNVYDIDAHREMKQRGVGLDPILRGDLTNVKHGISEASSSPQKLRQLRKGQGRISGFPQYLLWWFDLFELNFSLYVDRWRKEINPWFWEHINENVMRTWEELTMFVQRHPIVNPPSAQRALTEIFRTLLNSIPAFRPKRVSGREIEALLVKQPVPVEREEF